MEEQPAATIAAIVSVPPLKADPGRPLSPSPIVLMRVQGSSRMHTVHIADERRVDRIAQELPGPLRQARCGGRRNSQQHGLQRPRPSGAVLRCDDQSRRIRSIGAAPMPQRAFRDGDRSGRHRELHRIGPVAAHARLAPKMAAGNNFGGAVQFGGFVDRPEGADATGRPGSWNPNRTVIEVPGLHRFARVQIDRQTGR